VVTRYFLHFSTDWQDEMSVFLIVGSIFMSSAAVQARRGHVAIEAVAALLSDNANRWRLFFVDIATFVFCAYFSWKSALLLEEAIVEDFHSSSTWQPPLWIPYSLMTAGMTLLSIQVLFQIVIQWRRQRHERSDNRSPLWRRDAAGDVCRHADRLRARRRRDDFHDHVHAVGLGRYDYPERL
jgi:TRAP-type C4-dicarboxylate transport system permease small subunit